MLSKQSSEKLAHRLYSEIPDFRHYAVEFIDPEFRNNPYLIFGPLGSLLRDLIIANSSFQEIDKFYEFVNQLFKEENDDIDQMLVVTFFEPLMDSKQSINVSQIKLKDKALRLFEQTLKGTFFDGGKYAK